MSFGVKKQDALKLSGTVNSLREFLSSAFFEVTLCNVVSYYYTKTQNITNDQGGYLRYSPEPEIWDVAIGFNQFFSITPLFRIEDPKSDIHLQEFHVLDIYASNYEEDQMLSLLLKCLSHIEDKSGKKPLSNCKITKVTFENFRDDYVEVAEPMLILVTDYPISESNFDKLKDVTKLTTYKSEIFFRHGNLTLEIGVLGKVGFSSNPDCELKGYKFINDVKTVEDKNLYGGSLGLERVLAVYDYLGNL